MKIDTAAKDFIKDNRIFADLFNQYIYGGRQVLLPEQLEERDSTEISLPYGGDGTVIPVQKFRDVKNFTRPRQMEKPITSFLAWNLKPVSITQCLYVTACTTRWPMRGRWKKPQSHIGGRGKKKRWP